MSWDRVSPLHSNPTSLLDLGDLENLHLSLISIPFLPRHLRLFAINHVVEPLYGVATGKLVLEKWK